MVRGQKVVLCFVMVCSAEEEAVTNGLDKTRGFQSVGGVMADEAISLLRSFYEQGNPNGESSLSILDGFEVSFGQGRGGGGRSGSPGIRGWRWRGARKSMQTHVIYQLSMYSGMVKPCPLCCVRC